MRRKNYFSLLLCLIFSVLFLLAADIALATQTHGTPEGIYVHQVAHAFFAGAMVIFIYWLRQRKLILQKGWRYIQYSAIFLIFWNINVLIVHLLDEQLMLIVVENVDAWTLRITSPVGKWLEIYYYCSKMDHLLCVPALLFLFQGLRRLMADSNKSGVSF